ncbi:MAG: flagellar biosynthesis regulator FlaF [Pseudomonadota bacterium]
MNASAAAIRGYGANATSTQSDRRGEYETFARVTKRLRDAAMSAKEHYPLYVEALSDNQRLWTALAVDVADKENGLPDSLKARILFLADFTRVHTQDVLTKNASVVPLLEINIAVMRGLKGDGVQS